MVKNIRRRFTAYIIISYIVVFLVPLLVSAYLFSRCTVQMQNNMKDSNLAVAENIAQNVNNLLKDLKEELRSLFLQTANIQKLPVTEGVGNPLNFNQLHLQLFLKTRSNPILDSSYIMLFDENKVITPFVAGNSLDTFYGSYFKYRDMEFEEFLRESASWNYERELLPYTSLERNGYQGQWTMLVQSVRDGSYLSSKGVILFVLDFQYITDLMKKSLPDNSTIALTCTAGDEAYMISTASSGNIQAEQLSSMLKQVPAIDNGTEEVTFNNQKYFISRKSEETYGIQVAMIQSSASALSAVSSFRLIIIGQVLLSAFVVSMLIYYNTRRNVNSVQTIMDTFSSVNLNEAEMKDVYGYIRNAASKTVSQNLMLQSYVDKQQGIMVEAFLRRLIGGDYLYESDIIQEMEELDFSMEYQNYTAVLCHVKISRDDGYAIKSNLAYQAKQSLRNAVMQKFDSGVYLIDYDISSLVLLFGSHEKPEEMKHQIEELFSDLFPAVPMSICGGTFVQLIYDIPKAYKEARYVQNNIGKPGRNVVWYMDIYREVYKDVAPGIYQNSLYTEQNLQNQIMVGNEYEAKRQLDAFLQGYVEQNGSSPKALRCFTYELYRLAGHVLSTRKGEHEKAVELNRQFDAVMLDSGKFQEFYQYVRELCVTVSHDNKKEKGGRVDAIIEKVLGYVRENYADSQISVASIAEYCQLSPKYLSQFFKEQTNENISSSIEKLRIEKACEYLKGTEVSINDISERVGYTNPHTFRAAFKRCMFVTPREFREM